MRTLRFIHRWLGITLALPLLVQGLTGAVLTLEPAIAHWGAGAVRDAGSANAAIAGALAVAPAGMRAARYAPPPGESEPARVTLLPADRARGPGQLVEVDPATGRALGPPHPAGGVMETVKRLHETWLMPELGGRQFAGWLGVGLVALVLLGAPLWWPRAGAWGDGAWREGFTVPRRARGARLQRRLHGALGGWLAVLLLATGLTGIVQGFPATTRAMLGLPSGGPPRPGGGGGGGGGRGATAPLDMDAVLALARRTAPELALRVAFLPLGAEPVRLMLGPPGTDGASTVTTLTIDPAGTRVISSQGPASFPAGDRAMRVAKDLHTGDGFGPVWRGLTVLTGVALPGFGMTGVLLWWLKRRNRARVTAGVAQTAS